MRGAVQDTTRHSQQVHVGQRQVCTDGGVDSRASITRRAVATVATTATTTTITTTTTNGTGGTATAAATAATAAATATANGVPTGQRRHLRHAVCRANGRQRCGRRRDHRLRSALIVATAVAPATAAVAAAVAAAAAAAQARRLGRWCQGPRGSRGRRGRGRGRRRRGRGRRRHGAVPPPHRRVANTPR